MSAVNPPLENLVISREEALALDLYLEHQYIHYDNNVMNALANKVSRFCIQLFEYDSSLDKRQRKFDFSQSDNKRTNNREGNSNASQEKAENPASDSGNQESPESR
jgi:hypothetical protein